MTREEFLDIKNAKLLKEVKQAFDNKENNVVISLWFIDFMKQNPDLQMCQFMGSTKTTLTSHISYNYQATFINMCIALKHGLLKVTNDQEHTI